MANWMDTVDALRLGPLHLSGARSRTVDGPLGRLHACIVQNHPDASHPPLDVRAQLVQHIMDQGEDLTGMLTAESLFE